MSKLYGHPRLHDKREWPLHEGAPLLLLCELDFAEIFDQIKYDALPRTGGLHIFVATTVDEDSDEIEVDGMAEPDAFCVRYVPKLAALPLATDGVPAFAPKFVRFVADKSIYPQADSLLVSGARLNAATGEEYQHFIDDKLPDGPLSGNRLGGYPHVLQQNDLEARAAAVAMSRTPKLAAKFRDAKRWRLFLQIDSDDKIMWGTDSGIVYFMIHADDLAAQDFSQVVALTDGC